jgi:hypothetical protein
MTKPATAIEYITMPVATVVGATLKLFTLPLNATGKEATLNDISIWPRAMAIIGTQESCAVAATLVPAAMLGLDRVVTPILPVILPVEPSDLTNQLSCGARAQLLRPAVPIRKGPYPASGTRTSRRVGL